MPACFDDRYAAGTYGNVFAPAVDHGKGQFGIFFDVKFADADMHAFFHTGIAGTAGDDIQLGAFFHDHDIMDALQLLFMPDKNTGLQGSGDLLSGFDTDKIALLLL